MPLELTTVDNHSFVESRLVKGPVLDAGARGFRFSEWFAQKGHAPVIAIDADPTYSQQPKHEGVTVLHAALLANPDPSYGLRMTEDPEARYVTNKEPAGTVPVRTLSMAQLDIKAWDIVKLNIEGPESDILANWPGPIARQIVVSFHEHCAHAKRGDDAIWKVVQHLSKWYAVVRHIKDARYCAGENFWNSVFILKDLVFKP